MDPRKSSFDTSWGGANEYGLVGLPIYSVLIGIENTLHFFKGLPTWYKITGLLRTEFSYGISGEG